jgi:chromosome partitioning protein
MQRTGTHVIVVGNEKGGSGKSTTAFHLASYLLYRGFRVASIDADSRQQTFTNYVRNRRHWAQMRGLQLPHTTHFHLPLARSDSIRENQKLEFDLFRRAVVEVEGDADYLVVDTPGFDTHLTRLAHSLADTLITPLNDSLIDLAVMAHIDPVSGEPREMSHYSRLVQRARAERLSIDGQTIDWVLVRNRISMLSSRNTRQVQGAIDKIAARLGCRVAEGIAERVIFRSLFPMGLTVFDPLSDDVLGGVPSTSHASARVEYQLLVDALHLPLGDNLAPAGNALGRWSNEPAQLQFAEMAPAPGE